MAHTLTRLLRLRRLVEQTSRMELESRTALAERIEGERLKELRTAREGRTQAVASICSQTGVQEQAAGRISGWQAAENAEGREAQLGELARAVEQRVMESREIFLERRKDRQQLECVLKEAEQQMRSERERRIQRELDDWFGAKKRRLSRGARIPGES